jgi:hypothetical protein
MKKELVSAMQLYLQAGRLKIARALPDADLLRDEILNFRVKVSIRTGEETYEAWREGVHDAMVLATALPLWYATRYETKRPLFDSEARPKDNYDPLRFGL